MAVEKTGHRLPRPTARPEGPAPTPPPGPRAEPTRDQIAQDYTKALAIIDNLQRERAELLVALKVARELLDRNDIRRPEIDAALQKAEGR